MADFDWSWPKKIDRDVIERALTLVFLGEGRNLILVGTNGLGKTMTGAVAWAATPPDPPSGAPPLSPIRSLAYFRPVIAELHTHPVPDGYLNYLRLKLRRAATALSADAQKTTYSDDR